MREMSFAKLKVISHSLCKTLGIPLSCAFTKIRLLYIAKIKNMNHDFILVGSTLNFLNDF